LRAGEVGELLAGVATALHHAHEKGLVHRDVKPSNVLIDTTGRSYVTDFGLAIRAERFVPGQIAGTPAYMSPEQWRGGAVDRTTDVWAVGVMLYELLAGNRPFAGTTVEEIRAAVLYATTEPLLLSDDVPAAFRGIVQRCLAAHPEERFASCADLADALRRAGAAIPRERPHRVLWVNDKPEQGEEEVAHLRSLGVEVIRAASTTEAMRHLISGTFIPDVVVSDMGRLEEGEDRPHAGLLLTELVRKGRFAMPVVIYGSPKYKGKNQAMSLAIGGDGAVADRNELYRFLCVIEDE
jgi:serine/threonine protein kinase